jgi:hypothetical protein
MSSDREPAGRKPLGGGFDSDGHGHGSTHFGGDVFNRGPQYTRPSEPAPAAPASEPAPIQGRPRKHTRYRTGHEQSRQAARLQLILSLILFAFLFFLLAMYFMDRK